MPRTSRTTESDVAAGALVVVSLDVLRAVVREELDRRADLDGRQRQREDLPPWVSAKRAAELTSRSVATIRREIKAGTLAARRMGGRVLVSTEAVLGADGSTVAVLAAKARAG